MQRPAHEPELRCLPCGYTITEPSPSVCPECGHLLDPTQLALARLRRDMEASPSRFPIEHKLAAGFGLLSFGVVALLVSESSLGPLLSIAALSGWIACTLGLGVALGWLAPRHLRVVMRESWAAALPWIHGPWLVTLPIGFALWVFAMLDTFIGTDGAITAVVILVGMILWIVANLMLVIRACDVWGETLRRLTGAARSNTLTCESVSVLALFACMLVSAALGMITGGGVVATAMMIAG